MGMYGHLVKATGYGYADVELKVPVSPRSLFQSGSAAKQFTATALMLLIQDGKIGIDDPIGKYFPQAGAAAWRDVAVRRLPTLKLDFTPGDKWNYSNTGRELPGFLMHRESTAACTPTSSIGRNGTPHSIPENYCPARPVATPYLNSPRGGADSQLGSPP